MKAESVIGKREACSEPKSDVSWRFGGPQKDGGEQRDQIGSLVVVWSAFESPGALLSGQIR